MASKHRRQDNEIEGIDPEEDMERFSQEMYKRINEELQIVGSIAAFANAIRVL